MTQASIVLTTAGSQEEARKVAAFLVQQRIAACVNIVPQIESVYRWKGEVETASEWLLIIKTSAPNFEKIRAALERLHSYELPECIQLEISAGSQKYLDWLSHNSE